MKFETYLKNHHQGSNVFETEEQVSKWIDYCLYQITKKSVRLQNIVKKKL